MSATHFCSYCRTYHPIAEMRPVMIKGGKRWRCVKSIEASKKDKKMREAFGRQVSANNIADAQSKVKQWLNPERIPGNVGT